MIMTSKHELFVIFLAPIYEKVGTAFASEPNVGFMNGVLFDYVEALGVFIFSVGESF